MNTRKTVLINYLGRRNSGPVFTIEFAKALLSNGYDVSAIVSAGSDNIEQWKHEKRLSELYIVDTYSSNFQFVTGTVRLFLFERNKIKKHFRSNRYDYIIRPFYHPWTTFIDSAIDADEIITVCHDPINHSGHNRIRSSMFGNYIRSSDIVVVLTKSFINTVHDIYGVSIERIKYMPLGLLKIYKEKQSHSIHYFEEGKINFVFFGRIEKYKGVDILVKAYEKLTKDFNNITLTIAGSGLLDESISSKRNTLHGLRIENRYIPDEEVGCFFDGPNVCVVLPYIDATQSGVIPIAIEYGTPIIASDTGGLREQMLDGEFGVFVRPNDVNDLYEGMKSFIENSELFKKERDIMRTYSQKLEWDYVVSQLMAEIENP